MSATVSSLLDVEGLTMRFGGLTALSLCHFGAVLTIVTRYHRAKWRGQDDAVQLLTGFYRPTAGHPACRAMAARRSCSSAWRPIGSPARPTCSAFQKSAIVRRHERAGEPHRRAARRHRVGDRQSGRRAAGDFAASPSDEESTRERARGWIAWGFSPRPTKPPAASLTARSGVSKSRARCARGPLCSVSTNLPRTQSARKLRADGTPA